ncbi:sigma-70 family RNA polymerase sigma factor [Tessaracoccus sp. OS52]|uniref:sigma-70 family RNA polymerase sigma factor n=1 Tax=Tessaracoccus sp. OS52 TaxID=2886691 RepID=UPI001D12F13D|nr:sigma-70 family RNA polymerase sigma factor [Tessaracoccus sp. OS52]MCC2592715.1 sigma-70 family RNA polymerase sigma factor [Tessaracoccus sp. OS52]
MNLSVTRIDDKLLTGEEEVDLARAIEAGVYAEHLLGNGDTSRPRDGDALQVIAAAGRLAWQELWTGNLRLVMHHASDFSRRHGLPFEELFQEGCLGLAGAMQRYDFRRGLRFTTLAHEYVLRAVAASAARRCGMLEGPLHRQRIRQRIRKTAEHVGETGIRELARLAGVSVEAAVAAQSRTTTLDEIPSALAVYVQEYDRVDGVGTDFLNLIGDEAGEFLRLRFGVGRPEHSLRQLATKLGISESTARRLEAGALDLARTVLSQDDERCVLPSSTRTDPTMKAMGSRLWALSAGGS